MQVGVGTFFFHKELGSCPFPQIPPHSSLSLEVWGCFSASQSLHRLQDEDSNGMVPGGLSETAGDAWKGFARVPDCPRCQRCCLSWAAGAPCSCPPPL